MSQVVDTPTYTAPSGDSSLIDLVLMSNTSLLNHCSTVPPLANSDHNGIVLSFTWRSSERQVQQEPRTIWRYRNADFSMACQLIDNTDWESLLPMDDVDFATANWHNKFMEIMAMCIPQQSLRKKMYLG